MSWILENWTTIAAIVAGLMSVASMIVTLTPTPKDDEVLKVVRDFLVRISFLQPSDSSKLMKMPGAKAKK